eukprot:scaffold1638_cov112-Skeletonema_dohrnii-CCMP3373.AAC.3
MQQSSEYVSYSVNRSISNIRHACAITALVIIWSRLTCGPTTSRLCADIGSIFCHGRGGKVAGFKCRHNSASAKEKGFSKGHRYFVCGHPQNFPPNE